MIPINLKIRHFMCYRDNVPPLHFEGIHTACISGDNGSGKSAIIDAMTWALWGRSRAASDDDLVYTGETEMTVEFDFAVGGTPYRIIRKHARPGSRRRSGQTLLEFQIATGEGYRTISADTLTQTQQKIIEVLRMDYGTFINSAFLRQGRADEFTKQPPGKRKQVLADILGLAFYDRLEEQSRERALQHKTERDKLEGAVADIGQELARQPEYEAALGAAQAELARLEKEAGEVEAALSHLRQEKEALENQQWQLGRLREQITAGQADLERWQEQLSQHQARIRDYEGLLGQRAAIEDGFARFSRARQRADELDRNFRRWAALAERRHHLEMKVQQLGQELVTAHAVAQRRIQEMEAIVQKLPRLRAELGQVQAGLPRLAQTEEGLRQKRQRAQALEVSRHSLGSDQARLEAVLGEIEERLKLLATEGGVKCPLCDTELGPQGRQRLEAKYAAERQARTDELAAARSGRERQEQELAALKAEVAGLEAGLVEARTALQSRTGQLGQAVKEAEEAGQPLEEARLELADIERRLAGREFAAAEQQALRQLDEELAALDYDAGRHEQARQSLAELARYEAPQRRLEEADRLIGQEREAATRAEAAAGELRRRLELDREQEQALAAEMGRLPPLLERLAGVEAAYRGLAGPREQARQAVARAGSNLEHCAELAARQREKQGLIAAAAREEGLYRDLAQAFGKKGVQAWLIEMALPEIEEEANRLLARMTENRMHVKMETQRETKKGDLVETLDINIADELGTRDYEMFSGGEAFRINFAIRIALSRLLARRAGAPLPTLIVDEGFGTQDSTGIERLKEAINSIQDNFEKIIVITHIDELKDAFPTRIEVVKTAAGSTLEVSG